jgi:phospholipid-binding lipoprotein MlaA
MRTPLPPPLRLPLILLAGACLAGCTATTPRAGDLPAPEADRWEKTNRRVYALNKQIDRFAFKPAAKAYRFVTPRPLRTAIANGYSNFGEPGNFVNALLQGKLAQAFRTFDRFLINSILGVGGLADHATGMGRPQESEDYGQTLAWWGVKSGPYVVLPVFGPSTLRDGFGIVADQLADPASLGRNALFDPARWIRLTQTAGQLVNLRSRVIDQGGDQLLADSLDEYTLVKSAWLQRRKSLLYDGNPPIDDAEFEDVPAEPATDPVAAAAATPAADPAAAAGAAVPPDDSGLRAPPPPLAETPVTPSATPQPPQ